MYIQSGGFAALQTPNLIRGSSRPQKTTSPVGGWGAGAPQPGVSGARFHQNEAGILGGGRPPDFMNMCKIPGPYRMKHSRKRAVQNLKRKTGYFLTNRIQPLTSQSRIL